MSEYALIVCFDSLTCLFITLDLSKINRRGVDTSIRGESLVGNRVSAIEDVISRGGETSNLASGSGSTIEASVSLIGEIIPRRRKCVYSVKY